MNFYSYMSGLSSGVAEDSESLTDSTLSEHDRRHHPDGYKEGDTCKFRDDIAKETKPDELQPNQALTGFSAEGQHTQMPSEGEAKNSNSLMSRRMCEKMIRRAFVIGNIKEYDEIETPEDWLRERGADDVAMILENYSELYHSFIEPIQDELGDNGIVDVIKAYQRGELSDQDGSRVQKTQKPNLNISESPRVRDERFYSGSNVEATRKDLEIGKQRAVGKDKDSIYQARGKILVFSHNRGAAEKLGISQNELNRLLRSWSAYPTGTLELSKRVNDGIGESAQWHGLENMANLSRFNARNEDVARLVRSISGDSNQFQRNYITRAMMALDTHIDYSGLAFEFRNCEDVKSYEKCVNGYYSPAENKIVCIRNAPETVAHEMGHYIDRKWGEDLSGGTYKHHLTSKLPQRVLDGDSDISRFCSNFNELIEDLDETAVETSEYTLRKTEIFARFVASFVAWVERKSTGIVNTFADNPFGDGFNERQYLKFIRILQEKAYLDAKIMHAESKETMGE